MDPLSHLISASSDVYARAKKVRGNKVARAKSTRLSSVADLQRGMGGPLHGPEGAGGPERAPGWRKFVGRSSGNVPILEKNQIFTNKRPKSWAD